MSQKSGLISVLSIIIIITAATLSYADYGEWNEGGEVVCSADDWQKFPCIVPDGAGGAFIAWTDHRNDEDPYHTRCDVYVQRVDANGDTVWTKDGILIGDHTNPVYHNTCFDPQAVSDGAGGVIVVFNGGETNLHAQRLDEDGNLLWGSDGVVVLTYKSMNYGRMYNTFHVASDGAGGVLATWNMGYYDPLPYYYYGVWAQRVDSSGTIKWATNDSGVCIDDDVEPETRPYITCDGRSGGIIAWNDDPSGWHMYAQRVDSVGYKKWGSSGVQVNTGNYYIGYHPGIASDGLCGAIITWTRNSNGHVYAQRVDSDGDIAWQSDVTVSELYATVGPIITEDGDNGALITCSDPGSDTLAVQKIDEDGDCHWGTKGFLVCSSVTGSEEYDTAPDGQGGAITAWRDLRSSGAIYAMRIDSDGNGKWKDQGIPICTASGDQRMPKIVSDDDTGAIVTWYDTRDDDGDIYAQKIDSYFDFPTPDCEITYQFIASDGDTVTWRDFMNGCPAGDYETLQVFLDFDEADVPRDIEACEITIDKPDTLITFWSDGDITADSAAVCDSDIETSITHSHFGHNYAWDYHNLLGMDVTVLLNGSSLGVIDSLIVKSPDYTGDGYVSLSDLEYIGKTYLKCQSEPDYNPWFDFTGNNCVQLSDYGLFGTHYQHTEPTGYEGMFLAGVRSLSDVTAAVYTGGRTEGNLVNITITLSNCGDTGTLCMGLKSSPDMEYAAWIPNPIFPATSAAAPVTRHGEDMILLSVFNFDRPGDGELEIGILAFTVTNDAAAAGELSFVFGEVLDGNGEIKFIRGIENKEPDEMPAFANALGSNYPNPFNPATTIEYSIAGDSHVNLSIYSVSGQLVRTLVDGFRARNNYQVVWDGRDNSGRAVASGVYFYRITTGQFTKAKKLILMR